MLTRRFVGQIAVLGLLATLACGCGGVSENGSSSASAANADEADGQDINWAANPIPSAGRVGSLAEAAEDVPFRPVEPSVIGSTPEIFASTPDESAPDEGRVA